MSDAPPTRTVLVRLFGPQARAAGVGELRVPLAEGGTVGDLRAAVAEASEPLRSSLAGSRFAVDHAYAAEDAVVPASAEVALIGLVSGG